MDYNVGSCSPLHTDHVDMRVFGVGVEGFVEFGNQVDKRGTAFGIYVTFHLDYHLWEDILFVWGSGVCSFRGRSGRRGRFGSVMNWHFSRSFRLIFLNTYDLYLSRSYLINLTTLVSNHFAYSLCSQVTRKHVY